MTAHLQELVARLEKLDRPSKEIDRALAKLLGWHRVEPKHTRSQHGAWIAPEDFHGVYSDGAPILDSIHGTTMHRDVPDYTGSIDDALKLAMIKDGFEATLVINKDHIGNFARVANMGLIVEPEGRAHKSLPAPVVLCIASLRARIELAKSKVGA